MHCWTRVTLKRSYCGWNRSQCFLMQSALELPLLLGATDSNGVSNDTLNFPHTSFRACAKNLCLTIKYSREKNRKFKIVKSMHVTTQVSCIASLYQSMPSKSTLPRTRSVYQCATRLGVRSRAFPLAFGKLVSNFCVVPVVVIVIHVRVAWFKSDHKADAVMGRIS